MKTWSPVTVLGLSLALLASFPVKAQQQYSQRELAMLPSYCVYTNAFRQHLREYDIPAEVNRVKSLFGDMYGHMHHYCWGLAATNRATFAKTTRDRQRFLNGSIPEFDYVLKWAKPDFVLLPEILTRKGENLIRLGRATQGIPVLLRAIEVKADYWPPYATLSDYYKSIGERVKAREWLEKGLSSSPDANALKQRLADLGAPK